jgi:DNA-binding NarL/FixJ family response regulator
VIRVLIVDDHPVVRAGLAGMLAEEPDLDVVGEADGGERAVELAASLRPDVVLMDLRMPGGPDGVEVTGRLLSQHPNIKVLILTTYDTDRDIVRAVAAGATGYLLKDASRQVLIDAIRAAARGETVLTPHIAAKLADQIRRPAPPALTQREIAVLMLVALGSTNADIGRQLHITEATVKTHLLRVFSKLDVADRTAAVTTASRLGLLPEV